MAAVRYFVQDVDRAVAFYVSLGFSEVERWGPAMAIIEHDGLELWLAGPSASASKPMPDGRQPEPGGWNRIVLTVADLEAIVPVLRAQGVTFRNEPLSGPGGSQVLIEDPDGNPGPIPSATEVVTVHALEGAIGWRARREDGSRRHLMLGLGLNRGRAENNRIDDESFAASGIGVRIDAGHRWASGLTVDGVVAWRQQSGSDVENVTVSGMETQAVWPKNTTWVVGVAAGYAL